MKVLRITNNKEENNHKKCIIKWNHMRPIIIGPFFVVLPLYTAAVYFKSNYKDVIEMGTFSFNSSNACGF